ncbi:MAG: imidazole glycerol phosphate synthase cyclase subunit [Candidatus Omnitrophota bacterium]|nr:imidazole glycerol phosphate synthase cyclase subunit [Candidatus Omnitrophota bacterium]
MKKNRLIPVLLLKNGWLVQSKSFQRYQNLGDPITSVRRLSNWASDELIFLDMTREGGYDMRRDDKGHPNRHDILEIIEDVSKECLMPIAIGGRIRTLTDIMVRLASGADKVCVNTKPLEDPAFITEAAREYGSQCIIISIDAKVSGEGRWEVYKDGGKVATGRDPESWAREVESRGAGEILINCIDRDGARTGYDLDLVGRVSDAVSIPVIAMGGVGEWEHFAEALSRTKADAVAAANIFHYYDQSVYLAKKYLHDRNFNVRAPDLIPVEVTT